VSSTRVDRIGPVLLMELYCAVDHGTRIWIRRKVCFLSRILKANAHRRTAHADRGALHPKTEGGGGGGGSCNVGGTSRVVPEPYLTRALVYLRPIEAGARPGQHRSLTSVRLYYQRTSTSKQNTSPGRLPVQRRACPPPARYMP
jgi:hypothetical protein